MVKCARYVNRYNQYLELMNSPEEVMREIYEDAVDWSQQDEDFHEIDNAAAMNFDIKLKGDRTSVFWCHNFNGHARGDGEISAWFDDSLSKVSVGTVSDNMMQEKYNQVSKLWKRWPLHKAELVASETRLVLPKRILEMSDGEKRIYASRGAFKAQQLGEAWAAFWDADSIVDVGAGYGGFAQYYST